MNWFQKIAQDAFDDEMENLTRNSAVAYKSKSFNMKNFDTNPSGTNVGKTDEYNPTETETNYGQAL